MSGERALFLALLKDHFHNYESASIANRIDWDELYSIAREQSLTGVCYVQLKKLAEEDARIDDDVLEHFHKGFFGDVYRAVNHKKFYDEVANRFQAEGICLMPFKGWVIQKYWPIPELRTMGDIDLLINRDDCEKADAILKSMGLQRYIDNHAVWTYYAKDILLELHNHMFYEHLTNEIDYQSYFDRAWNYYDDQIDESFHFLYLVTHLAKHIINKGIGFRAYLDLAFFCENAKQELRWDWICQELTDLKLMKFLETCFALCRYWFGFEPPIPVAGIDETFCSFITDKTFSDGTFGLENEQNDTSGSAKEILHRGASYWVSTFDLSIKRLFPPYEDMQLIPWYAFVDGRPWLLPAAWIYRWGYCLIHKRKQGTELLLEPFRKRDVIEKREHLIHDWGF